MTELVSVDDLSRFVDLVNLGLAGFFLWAFMKEWIVPGRRYKAAIDERHELEDRLELVNQKMQSELLPAVLRAADLIEDQRARLAENKVDSQQNSASLAQIGNILGWLAERVGEQRQILESISRNP